MWLLPRTFRSRYGADMAVLLEDRLAETQDVVERGKLLLVECGNVLVTALRLRLRGYPLQAPALLMLIALLWLVRATGSTPVMQPELAADSVDFRATDPAGEFTLSLRAGRVVRATIDRQTLEQHQLVQTTDSIRVLNRTGRVLFAVAYDRDAGTIAWDARPAACRGRALQCGVQQ